MTTGSAKPANHQAREGPDAWRNGMARKRRAALLPPDQSATARGRTSWRSRHLVSRADRRSPG